MANPSHCATENKASGAADNDLLYSEDIKYEF